MCLGWATAPRVLCSIVLRHQEGKDVLNVDEWVQHLLSCHLLLQYHVAPSYHVAIHQVL